jgi:hypothetical protein
VSLILLFTWKIETCFKVIWIERCTYSVNECLGMFCYWLLFIRHKHHVTLMHSWYSSSAYACNRCTGGRDLTRIRRDEPGSSRGAATRTRSLEGAGRRRSARRGHRWLPEPRSVQFRERQATEHYKPPNLWNAIEYYVIYIVALSYRCWMKTLVALISNPCPDIITMNPK